MTKFGIIGGMGPEATKNVQGYFIELNKHKPEQEHPNLVILSCPSIPDRTEAILNDGESPLEDMIKTAKSLETLKVDCIIVTCITAHYFVPEVQKHIKTPICDALEILKEHLHQITRIGVLSTSGTKATKIFDQKLNNSTIFYPDGKDQLLVMDAIYGKHGIKRTGNNKHAYHKIYHAGLNLNKQYDVEVLIAGCTELPLLDIKEITGIKVIDPMRVLVEWVTQKYH